MFTFSKIGWIWFWVAVVVALLLAIGIGVLIGIDDGVKTIIIGILIALIISEGLVFGFGAYCSWRNTHTASGARHLKDMQSELENGIDREVTITAEDGREIFHYEGKIDIESNHEDNYIKFEAENGKRYVIYYGIQDTITIIEK